MQNLLVREPNHVIGTILKPFRTRRIVLLLQRMHSAVDLNYQSRLGAAKVDDDSTNGVLPPEVVTGELSPAQVLPQLSLGWRRGLAKFAGTLPYGRIDP